MSNKTEITNINQFMEEIRRCRELEIPKPGGYSHHGFVGEVDDDGCNFYHYTRALTTALKLTSPLKIIKTRLNYDRYRALTESREIFNFDNGDVVFIVHRKDYPNDEKSEEVCIKRAKSRLGEEEYSVSDNNCQCYVNWIFSNDNTSEQIKSSTLNQTAGDAIDGVLSTGILHPLMYLASGAIHYSQKKTLPEKSDVNTKNLNAQTSENKEEKNHKENETKEIQKEKTGKKSMNVVNNPDEKTNTDKKGSTESLALKKHTEITNAKTVSNGVGNAHPRSFEDICLEEKIKEEMQHFQSQKLENKYEKEKGNTLKDERHSQIIGKESKMPQQEERIVKADTALSQKLSEETKFTAAQALVENSKNHSKQSGELKEEKKTIYEEKRTTNSQNLQEKTTEFQTQKLNEESQIPCLESRRLKEESRQFHLLALKEDPNRVEKESGCTMKHSQKAQELTENAGKPHLLTQNEDVLRQQLENCNKLEEMDIKEHAINKHPRESEKSLSNARYSSTSDDTELNYLGVLPLAACTNLKNCSNIQNHLLNESEYFKAILDRQSSDYATTHLAKHVAKSTQDESMKKASQSLSTASVYFAAAVEIGSLARNIYRIQTNEHMTKEQKTKRTAKEVCASVYGVSGSVLGQAIIPIPVIGGVIGGFLGNALGGAVGGSIFS